jgi:type III restriction enzyme
VADRRIENPIINSPFAMPDRHFRFDDDGITDDVVEGRRPSQYFMPIPASKKRTKAQQVLLDEGPTADRIVETKFVNELRDRVDVWRRRDHPHVTGTTRRLLEYWSDPDRDKPLFFCQIEALETAIFLTEAAAKETTGAYFNNELQKFADDANPGLFRVAHKMATGTGKTVVMAMLIAWQTLNKAANPQDRRFTDAFLVVCPGITIRDRLRVLMPSDPNDYYAERDLVPPELKGRLGRAAIEIVNFHQLRPRTKLNAPKTTKQILGPKAVEAGVFVETPAQMVNRVCAAFKTKRNIVVLNDEAHHCYRRRPTPVDEAATVEDLKGDEKKEAAERDEEARVWISGIEAVAKKLGVRTVYDLSATPFFLNGSGYREGNLFPWVVSDFALIDAIEAGLVKIPRVPVDDNASNADELPTYRNLWLNIHDSLPKKGRKADDNADPNLLPLALQGAIKSLYANYAEAYRRWEKTRIPATPPVFIVVCNNTTVSKMVFDHVAGWAKPQPDGTTALVPGRLDLFSNVDADVDGGRFTARPKTILVDSSQLESGEGMSDEFKKIAATEIAEFKADYRARFPGRDVDELTDEDLLREVMNTVGKAGKLGEHVRCVVSVSMLTEGWDANTVTHILGVRAFGTQLLCEQVVGRGLRRMSYAVDDETGHFLPEYAEVYGIPFSFIPASGTDTPIKPPKQHTRVRALPERADAEITFPNVTGYRWEVPDEKLMADFTEESRLDLDTTSVPTTTEVAGVVGESVEHSLGRAAREQTLAFEIARMVLDRHFKGGTDGDGNLTDRPWLFPDLLAITRQWMADPDNGLRFKDNADLRLLTLEENQSHAADRIYRGIVRSQGAEPTLEAILRADEPTSSTAVVDFDTTKLVGDTDPTKCHVSHVVADSSWELTAAKRLEEMSEVVRYVKNAGLGFTIPYAIAGRQHQYVPDFIACIDDGHGPDDLLNLIIEVTGERRAEKAIKVATSRTMWVPAVNAHGGFGRWAFVEIDDQADVHAPIRAAVAAGPTHADFHAELLGTLEGTS